MGVGLGPLHRHEDRAPPLAADPDALDEAQDRQQPRAPDADRLISWHECDQECSHAHQQERGHQRGLATDAIPVMPEDRRTHWPRNEPDGIDCERLQRSHQRIGFRKVQLGEHQPGDGAVEKEVVPLDRGADCARDDGAPELPAVFCLRG